MKLISTLAIALSLAVGAAGMASAATTTIVKKPAAATCVATKTKPCPQQHAGIVKDMHKKHHVAAVKLPAKKDEKSVKKS